MNYQPVSKGQWQYVYRGNSSLCEVIKKKDESVSMVSRVELIKHCPVCI